MDIKGIFKKAVNLLTLSSFLLWNLAAAVPEGGQVAAGNAAITQSGSTTTINQTSQNAVINWHGFDTASHEAVNFVQPNSSSIALNRINSGTPTNFNGSLSANGQVWILNPSGVLFGASSKVDVAGLLVTTHNITDSNFMSGNYQFTFDPNSINSKIINNGMISAKDSGIVALVAPWVENSGVIIANLGKVYLSSGTAFVLDMYGDSLINFGSNAPLQNSYVSNSGLIQADGGKVHMTANSAAGILDSVISMTGTIQAKSVGMNKKGEIILYSSNAQTKKLSGVTKVTGKLDASNGGFIETSGESVDYAGADIQVSGGTWLIDPTDQIINAPQAATISSTLSSGGNVTITTTSGGTDAGDIFINAPIIKSGGAGATLTLFADRDIHINADLLLDTGVGNGAYLNATASTGKIYFNTTNINPGALPSGFIYKTFDINSPVVLQQDVIFAPNSGAFGVFHSTIDGPFTLTVGNADFQGNIGSLAPLASLHLTAPFRATGSISSISTTGEQIYDPQFFFFIIPSMTFTASKVILNNGLNNNNAQGFITVNGDLELTGQFGVNAFAGAAVPQLIVTGETILHNSEIKVGSAYFQGPVSVLGDAIISGLSGSQSSGNGQIEFANTVNGTGSLTLNNTIAGGRTYGNIMVDSIIDATSMSSFGISNGTLTLNGGTINTVNQTYTVPVIVTSLGGTFNDDGTVRFSNTVDGNGALTVGATNEAIFDGNVGVNNALNSLTVNAPVIKINTTGITNFFVNTVNDQIYNGNFQVTLRSDPGNANVPVDTLTSTSGDITFFGPITLANSNGIDTFRINAGHNVNFYGDVILDSGSQGGRMEVTASNAAAGYFINIHTGLFQLGTAPNSGRNADSLFLFSPTMLFQDFEVKLPSIGGARLNDMDGAYSFTMDVSALHNQIQLDGNIGTRTPLTDVSIIGSGALNINASQYITTGDQTYVISPVYGLRAMVTGLTSTTFTSLNGGTVTFDGGINRIFPQNDISINANAHLIGNFSGSLGLFTVTGSTFLDGATISTANGQDFQGAVIVSNAGALLNSSTGTINFESSVDGAPGNSGPLTTNAPNTQFDGVVNGNTALTSLNFLGAAITLNGGTINESSRIYSQILNVTALGGTLNASGLIQFNNTINGPGSLFINNSGNPVVFNSASGTALDTLNIVADSVAQSSGSISANALVMNTVSGADLSVGVNVIGSIDATNTTSGDINLTNTGALNITGISQNGGNLMINNTGAITQSGPMSVSGTSSFSAGANGIDLSNPNNNLVGDIALSNSGITNNVILVNSVPTILNTTIVGGALVLTSGGNITLNGDVTTGTTQVYNSAVILGATDTLTGSTITFNSTVDSTDGNQGLIINGDVVAIGNMGSAQALNGLTVNGNASGLTVTSGSSVLITGTLTLLSNDIYNVTGTVTFGGNIDSDGLGPWSLTTNATGDVFFNGDIGTANTLSSVTVNGTSVFNKGSTQSVITNGSQIYTNTVTLNNDAQLFAMDPGPLGTNIISFGAGAAGVNGPAYNLTVVTHNAANGLTGAGITGTVNVAGLTVGGEGGANLSPLSKDSIVGGGVGDSARTNTIVSPDFSPNAIYCVNGAFCALPPAPVTNFPSNIPPVEIFAVPNGLVSCDASGCTNLELIVDNLIEAGVVSCAGNGCPYGFVEARDTNGNSRILMQGGMVYAGDTIYKDKGTCVCVKAVSGKRTCYGPSQTKIVYEK